MTGLFVLLFSCELVVDIDIPREGGRLTLNAFITPDSLWKARLHLDRHILDDMPFQWVDNGTIVIYENNIPIDTLIGEGGGVYRSDGERPQPGKEYEISAQAGNFQSVSATAFVPTPAAIADIVITDEFGDSQPETIFKVRFKDDPSQKNFYQVSLEIASEQLDHANGTVVMQQFRSFLAPDNPQYKHEDSNEPETTVIPDLLFNGKEVELSFRTFYGITDYPLGTFSLRTLSEDYYKYQLTSALQQNTSGDPFAQPVNVHNNIENGFGIFAGYSSSHYSWEGERPVITDIAPMEGKPGDRVIISGERFNKEPYRVAVRFSGSSYPVFAPIISQTENRLEVTVPDNATSGKVIIETNGYVVFSKDPFTISN